VERENVHPERENAAEREDVDGVCVVMDPGQKAVGPRCLAPDF